MGERFPNKFLADAPTVLPDCKELHLIDFPDLSSWFEHLRNVRAQFPLVESCHRNENWVDSYSFIDQLADSAGPNTTFVTDMGTALISTFQVVEPSEGQRLFTSQGLGEMGYLPPIVFLVLDSTRQVIVLIVMVA